jgi:hypothetical protein
MHTRYIEKRHLDLERAERIARTTPDGYGQAVVLAFAAAPLTAPAPWPALLFASKSWRQRNGGQCNLNERAGTLERRLSRHQPTSSR